MLGSAAPFVNLQDGVELPVGGRGAASGVAPGVDDVMERLGNVIGRTVIGVRVGPSGFDLVFDDGTELEVYVFSGRALGLPEDRVRCVWSVVVARYRRYRVPDARVAEELAWELGRHLIETTVVGPLENGTVYIGVREDQLEELERLCPELSATAQALLCGRAGQEDG